MSYEKQVKMPERVTICVCAQCGRANVGANDCSGCGAEICRMGPECCAKFVRADLATPAGWQPMSSAPNGKKVLVAYLNPGGKWRRVCAQYYEPQTLDSETSESGYADEGWYEECESQETIYPVEYEPTHWMPLPPAPSAERVEEDQV